MWNPAFVGRGAHLEVLICAVTGFLGSNLYGLRVFRAYKNKLNPVFRIVFFWRIIIAIPGSFVFLGGLALAIVTLIIEKMMNKKINLEGLSA